MATEPVLTDPWWDLRGDGTLEHDQREAIATELATELGQGHPLHGQAVTVIGKSTARDDVLLALVTGGWAVGPT
jgi:hypothetical protein